MDFPIRINRYLALRGISTRREADMLIEKGNVLVNGIPAVLGQQIQEHDKVEITGLKRDYRYLAYYKPRGVITHSPSEGETDIKKRLANDYQVTDVFPVGRIDKDSEGLIILTNDGRVTERLLSPKNAHEKEYEVSVDKPIKNQFLRAMERGVRIEGYMTKPAQVAKKDETTFCIILTEGKKHQIRRMCAALGYQVKKLKRVRVLNIALGKLKPGQYRKIQKHELRAFLSSLGLL